MAQRRHKESTHKSADPERAQRQAIDERPTTEPIAGDKRQERQHGRGCETEHHAAREHRAERSGLGDVTQTGHDRAADPLARQVVDRDLAPPPEQRADQGQSGYGIEVECSARSSQGDHDATNRRP